MKRNRQLGIKLSLNEENKLKEKRNSESPGSSLSSYARNIILLYLNGSLIKNDVNLQKIMESDGWKKIRDVLFDDAALKAWGLKRADEE